MNTRKSEDIQRAELERRSRDLWKVKNPTNQDFQVVLNAAVSPEVWTIKANSEEIVPYYVAQMYASKMVDQIIYSKTDKAVLEENNRRLKSGFQPMNVHTEQMRFEGRKLKGLLSRREELAKILLLGIYKEYGIGSQNVNPEDRQPIEVSTEVDRALGENRAVFGASRPVDPPEVAPNPPQETINDKRLAALEKARQAKKEKRENVQ